MAVEKLSLPKNKLFLKKIVKYVLRIQAAVEKEKQAKKIFIIRFEFLLQTKKAKKIFKAEIKKTEKDIR